MHVHTLFEYSCYDGLVKACAFVYVKKIGLVKGGGRVMGGYPLLPS